MAMQKNIFLFHIFNIIFLLCLMTSADVSAWVHTGSLTISSQSEMDALAPGLTEVTVDLHIETADLTDLDSLASLTTVGNNFKIHNNAALANIDGLASLTSVGNNFEIHGNAVLANVDGLASLTSVGYWLEFHDNAALTNVDGLSSVTHIGEDLQFHNNASLTNIDGVASLTTVGCCIEIYDNPALTNIDGLASLLTVPNDLEILNNDALTNLDGLASLQIVYDAFKIHNNDVLTDIDKVAALTRVGNDFEIINNAALVNIPDFPLLTELGGELRIQDNPVLQNVDGFPVLETIEDYLEITNNPSLQTISGFPLLKSIGEDLEFKSNVSLMTISGFSSLKTIDDDFEIEKNTILRTIDAFSTLETVDDDFEIWGNSSLVALESFTSLDWVDCCVEIYNNISLVSFCGLHTMAIGSSSPDWEVYGNRYNPSRQQVIDAGPICPIPAKISGRVFYDADGNGICGSNEAGLAHVAVRFESEGSEKDTKLLADSNGFFTFNFYCPIGDFRLSIEETTLPEGFSYTTAPTIERTVPEQETFNFDGANFGFDFSDVGVVDKHNGAQPPLENLLLSFVAGSPDFSKESWSNAVDKDYFGWDGTATVREDDNGQVWAVFEPQGGATLVDQLSVITDNGADDAGYEFRQALEIDVLISKTGPDSNMFEQVGTFKVGEDYITKCRFGQTFVVNFIKIIINKPNRGAQEWRQIVEISLGDLNDAITKKSAEFIEPAAMPQAYSLSQNYPNPFNPATSIAYTLPEAQHIDIAVFNVRGDLVKQLVSGFKDAGLYNISWDATNAVGQKVTTGVYFYRINAGSFTETKKMTLMQ